MPAGLFALSVMLWPLCRHTMAEQFARGGSGAVTILERYLAVDEGVLVAFRTLDAAPFVARQIVYDLNRQHLQLRKVVHHDIRRCAFAQEAPIFEARTERRQRAQAPVNIL